MTNKTFYTKNISLESYTSINLICNAINKTEAFYKFKDYINKNLKNANIVFIISRIKELTKEVKEFYFSD